MGTSQSHVLKSGPNWSEAKRAVTSIAKQTGDTNLNCRKLMHGIANAIIGNGSRTSGSIGHAGARVSSNFIDIISSAKNSGYSGVIALLEIPEGQSNLTKEDFIERLVIYASGEHDSTEDDAAAVIAFEKLLNKLCAECSSPDEIAETLRGASNDIILEWIIFFEIEYILEYCGELFQSHILDKCEEPERVISEIRNWMHREIDDRLGDDIRPHNFSATDGKQLLNDLTEEILGIWKQS